MPNNHSSDPLRSLSDLIQDTAFISIPMQAQPTPLQHTVYFPLMQEQTSPPASFTPRKSQALLIQNTPFDTQENTPHSPEQEAPPTTVASAPIAPSASKAKSHFAQMVERINASIKETSLLPKENKPLPIKYRKHVLDAGENAYFIEEGLTLLHKENLLTPVLVTTLVDSKQYAQELAHSLIALYALDPSILKNPKILAILIYVKDRTQELFFNIKNIYKHNPSLLDSEILIEILLPLQLHPEYTADALVLLHAEDKDLLINKTILTYIKLSGKNSLKLAKAFILLKRVNPVFLSRENCETLYRAGPNALEKAHHMQASFEQPKSTEIISQEIASLSEYTSDFYKGSQEEKSDTPPTLLEIPVEPTPTATETQALLSKTPEYFIEKILTLLRPAKKDLAYDTTEKAPAKSLLKNLGRLQLSEQLEEVHTIFEKFHQKNLVNLLSEENIRIFSNQTEHLSSFSKIISFLLDNATKKIKLFTEKNIQSAIDNIEYSLHIEKSFTTLYPENTTFPKQLIPMLIAAKEDITYLTPNLEKLYQCDPNLFDATIIHQLEKSSSLKKALSSLVLLSLTPALLKNKEMCHAVIQEKTEPPVLALALNQLYQVSPFYINTQNLTYLIQAGSNAIKKVKKLLEKFHKSDPEDLCGILARNCFPEKNILEGNISYKDRLSNAISLLKTRELPVDSDLLILLKLSAYPDDVAKALLLLLDEKLWAPMTTEEAAKEPNLDSFIFIYLLIKSGVFADELAKRLIAALKHSKKTERENILFLETCALVNYDFNLVVKKLLNTAPSLANEVIGEALCHAGPKALILLESIIKLHQNNITIDKALLTRLLQENGSKISEMAEALLSETTGNTPKKPGNKS